MIERTECAVHAPCAPDLPTIVFVCGGNSARSVAAEHLSKLHFAGKAYFLSAGTDVRRETPKEGVLKELSKRMLLPPNIKCRKLEDLVEEQKLSALVLLCCKTDVKCPQIEKAVSLNTQVLREPLQGPKEMMSMNADQDSEESEVVYKKFVDGMEVFVQSRVPHILSQL